MCGKTRVRVMQKDSAGEEGHQCWRGDSFTDKISKRTFCVDNGRLLNRCSQGRLRHDSRVEDRVTRSEMDSYAK